MSRKLFVFAFTVGLAACSQGGQTQKPADSGKAPAPAPTSQSAAPEAVKPGSASAPPATAAPPLEQSSAQAERPSTSEKAMPPDTPVASAKPASGEKARPAEASPAAEPATPRAAEKAAAKPEFREVTIPAGTPLRVTLSTPVASDSSQVEDEVRGTLARAIVIDGVTAVPAGAEVIGTVRDAKRSGRVKGRASIALRFERLVMRGESLAMRTAIVSRQAASNRREDVKKGAIGAAAGAIIGGIAGGGKGAAIGAGVGGTGAVVATRGEEMRLPSGTTVRTTLQQPLNVVVPHQRGS